MLDLIRRYAQRWPDPVEVAESLRTPRLRTSRSGTIFNGEAPEWVEYLALPREERHDHELRAVIHVDDSARVLRFEPLNEASKLICLQFEAAFVEMRRLLEPKAFVMEVLDRSIFENASNFGNRLELRASSKLPSRASREMRVEADGCGTVHIVLQSELLESVQARLRDLPESVGIVDRLGILMPIFGRVISRLSYPNYPRDRFLEKIDTLSNSLLISVNLLYSGFQGGQLVPTQTGATCLALESALSGISLAQLYEDHPYYRLVRQLAFILLEEKNYRGHRETVKLLVRAYLDNCYLRLSVSGIMPDLAPGLAPMPFRRRGGKLETPLPKVGKFGITDRNDLRAWRALEGPLRDMGYTILSQLGAGEFGRVYDAFNTAHPNFPQRVAIKVDRLFAPQGEKRILDAETVIHIGDALGRSAHIIRLYDAGKISRLGATYHVLQRIDGDTLDNLLGITGREHASVPGPALRVSEADLRESYARSVGASPSESWRRQRLIMPFDELPSLTQSLDIVTSMLLWLEKVHHLGYVVNDLKNGNLMLSRRGQLKAIDLDSYAPAFHELDTMQDFLFLASTFVLYRLYSSGETSASAQTIEKKIKTPEEVREMLHRTWRHGDVAEQSASRVHTEEFIDLEVDLLSRSRDRSYVQDPGVFTSDIDRLIRLKRLLSNEDMALD